MKFVEPKQTEKYFEHKRKFNCPKYYNNIYRKGNGKSLWSQVFTLRAHPASVKLFLNQFVDYYPRDLDLREDLKNRYFKHNSGIHERIIEYILSGSSVLDVGAGIGCLKDLLEEKGVNVDYYANDISENLLNLNPSKEENKYCCDFTDLPGLVRKKRFDFIVDCNATHYKHYISSNYGALLDKLMNLTETYIYSTKSKVYKSLNLARYDNIIFIEP